MRNNQAMTENPHRVAVLALDHVIGLTFLLETFHQHPMRRATVHGDPRKLAAVREHLFHADLFPVPIPVEWRALAERVTLRDGGVVTHFPLVHPGGSLGYRIDWPGRSLAYVTDTTGAPAGSTATFTNVPYTLTMTLKDDTSGQTTTLDFTGVFNGPLTSGSSLVDFTFTGTLSQAVTLGGNTYTVSAGLTAPPGPPNGDPGLTRL